MIAGTLKPVVSGQQWTEQFYIVDDAGTPVAASILSAGTFAVRLKYEDSGCQLASTSSVTVLGDGLIQWTFAAGSIRCGPQRLRVTVDLTDVSGVERRLADLILPVLRA